MFKLQRIMVCVKTSYISDKFSCEHLAFLTRMTQFQVTEGANCLSTRQNGMLPVWGFWVSPVATTVMTSLLFAQISTTGGCKFYSESTLGYFLSQYLCSMTDKWSTPLKLWPLLKCQLDRLLPDQSDRKSF